MAGSGFFSLSLGGLAGGSELYILSRIYERRALSAQWLRGRCTRYPLSLRADSYLNSGMMGTKFYLVQEQSFKGHVPPVLNTLATAKPKVMEQE